LYHKQHNLPSCHDLSRPEAQNLGKLLIALGVSSAGIKVDEEVREEEPERMVEDVQEEGKAQMYLK
jgi:hypothetical protein